MRQIIYIEKALRQHPRVLEILARERQAHVIECEHYGEVFNPHAQNFRIQKQNPALILARKTGRLVLPTPEGFGIGGQQNYYFSHLLNCLYDCRYCFLQGMYNSAHYVLFVNYEDFMQEISEITEAASSPCYFFSGYDGDSLALDARSHFIANFLPFFAQQNHAILELRSKSTNIRPLLQHTPIENCIVAFSFTPDSISRQVEHKVPLVHKRIQAMKRLAESGWRLGLRLDPLIAASNFEALYDGLLAEIFSQIPSESFHSVSVGGLRFPEKMHRKLTKLYPNDKLLTQPMQKRDKHIAYPEEQEQTMQAHIYKRLADYVPKPVIFQCTPF